MSLCPKACQGFAPNWCPRATQPGSNFQITGHSLYTQGYGKVNLWMKGDTPKAELERAWYQPP